MGQNWVPQLLGGQYLKKLKSVVPKVFNFDLYPINPSC